MSLASLLDSFATLHALVVGDLMLDEYIHGRATRISPEAPVMVIRQQSISSVPGGAANVAQNIRALGAEARTAGVVGLDAAGDALESALRLSGELGLVRDPSRATTRKTRVLADHAHQVLRIDHEGEEPVSAEIEQKLLDSVMNLVGGCSVIVLSDYMKGALTVRLAQSLIAYAAATDIPVVVNPKPRSLGNYSGATLVSLNRAEAAEAVGFHQGIDNEDAAHVAQLIRERYNLGAVLITLGEGGMAVAGDSSFLVAAPRVEVYDTAGAGDTVIATVALGLGSGAGVTKAVFELAAQTAASVVRKVGVATPQPEDLAAIRGELLP